MVDKAKALKERPKKLIDKYPFREELAEVGGWFLIDKDDYNDVRGAKLTSFRGRLHYAALTLGMKINTWREEDGSGLIVKRVK